MQSKGKQIFLVWLVLMILLVLTAGSAFIPLGWGNTLVNFVIAVMKAALVALFYMHLRESHTLIRLAAVTGIATLLILMTLSGGDYLFRKPSSAPWQTPAQLPARSS